MVISMKRSISELRDERASLISSLLFFSSSPPVRRHCLIPSCESRMVARTASSEIVKTLEDFDATGVRGES